MKKIKIKKATAVYTGGGIWLFYGKLSHKKYFLMDDNGMVIILKENPKNLEESTYEEWQELHKTKHQLSCEEAKEFALDVLDYIKHHPDHSGGMTNTEIKIYKDWVVRE